MLNLPITEGELTFLAKFVNCAPILLCGRIAHTACNFYFRLNCDQIEVYFTLYFRNILHIINFGDILLFPSNFLCSSRISFTFPSKFISFKFPSHCKNFLSKGNFLQSGSADCDPLVFKSPRLLRPLLLRCFTSCSPGKMNRN
jgi:hypothetical protein